MGGRRRTREEPTLARREHSNFGQNNPRPEIESSTFLLLGDSAGDCTINSPCCKHGIKKLLSQSVLLSVCYLKIFISDQSLNNKAIRTITLTLLDKELQYRKTETKESFFVLSSVCHYHFCACTSTSVPKSVFVNMCTSAYIIYRFAALGFPVLTQLMCKLHSSQICCCLLLAGLV